MERPRIKLTTLDKVLEIIADIALGVAVILIFVLRGKGYGYNGTQIYLYLNLIIIGAFSILQRHNVYPRIFNFYFSLDGLKMDIPTQTVLYKDILRLLRWVVALTCSLFTYNILYKLLPFLQKLIIDIPFWLFLIGITVVVVFYFIKIFTQIEEIKKKNT